VSINALLEKYFGLVVLALIAVSAYFGARAVTALVGVALLQSLSPAVRAPSAATPNAVREVRRADALIERNPFDSLTGSLRPKIDSDARSTATGSNPLSPLSAPACSSLTAFIITESRDQYWSLAALQSSTDERPRLHRVGDEIDGHRVVFIGFNPRENSPSVWLASPNRLCQTLLFRAAADAPAASSRRVKSAQLAETRGAVPRDIASKIHKSSDTEFQLDRAIVDKILEQQAELLKFVRIVPEQRDGKVIGIRLFHVRPDSLLAAVGFKEGDRLDAINGFDIATPEKALEAYATFRNSSHLRVKLNRGGAALLIDYDIK
jgi:general secretion pathway protein C